MTSEKFKLIIFWYDMVFLLFQALSKSENVNHSINFLYTNHMPEVSAEEKGELQEPQFSAKKNVSEGRLLVLIPLIALLK